MDDGMIGAVHLRSAWRARAGASAAAGQHLCRLHVCGAVARHDLAAVAMGLAVRLWCVPTLDPLLWMRRA
jgi:hypothetical protein